MLERQRTEITHLTSPGGNTVILLRAKKRGRLPAPADGLDTAPAPGPCVPPPEPGAHGRIADDDSPQTRLERRPRWSAAPGSGRRNGL